MTNWTHEIFSTNISARLFISPSAHKKFLFARYLQNEKRFEIWYKGLRTISCVHNISRTFWSKYLNFGMLVCRNTRNFWCKSVFQFSCPTESKKTIILGRDFGGCTPVIFLLEFYRDGHWIRKVVWCSHQFNQLSY